MNRITKGSIEAEISNATVKLQREHLGRGATDVRAFLVGDLVIVRCTGIFTPTEARLVATDDGQRLIRQTREELRHIVREEMENSIADVTGAKVLRSYADMNVQASELIEIYVLDEDVEKKLLRQDLDRLGGIMPTKRL